MPPPSTAIIEEVVDQYFEEASFLWERRDLAVTAPDYSLMDLAELDERVEAHIDGLRVAGDHGWALCEAGLTEDEPGAVFTATVIAFETGDEKRTELVIGVGSKSRAAFRGMVSGLGWMDDNPFNSVIEGLVSNKSRHCRRLGIAACGIRRLDPREYLDQALNSSDLFLKALALKTAGELKRQDLLPLIRSELQHENHLCRFEAARSALLLGDYSALKTMGQFVQTPSSFRIPAMQIALRMLDTQAAQSLLKTISKDREHMRDVLTGMGISGDPFYIPTLLQQMEIPEMARVAGEAFCMITGVDLADTGLEGAWPDGFEAGPNDDTEDENVEMDMDEDLPWPDVNLSRHWWQQHNGQFEPGTRYLSGGAVTPGHCKSVLKNGKQRHRNGAALELALSEPATPFFNTKAPGHRQHKNL
jgi:uncharacterized protein (TIGR02270 family)